MVPDPVDTVNAPPKTVVTVSRIQFFAVEFGDDEGRKHITAVVRIGGEYYRDSNGETWAKNLTRLPETSWFHKQLSKMIEDREAEVKMVEEPLPKEDAVDVMGDQK
jgi:hypothetical protein